MFTTEFNGMYVTRWLFFALHLKNLMGTSIFVISTSNLEHNLVIYGFDFILILE